MTAAATPIAHKRLNADLSPARCLTFAQRVYGKGLFAQVREMLRLSRGIGKLTPREYFYYRLYDDESLTAADKDGFLGQAALEDLNLRILRNPWHHIAADKLTFYALLAGLGIPTPRTLAVWHPFRHHGGVAMLRDAADVAALLRGPAAYPLFAKPVNSVNSLGAAAIERYDAATDSLELWGGGRVPVDKFIAQMGRYVGDGYLFQERITSDPELAAITGNRISSLRVYVIIGEAGPEILRASWKIAVGDNPADNFWRPGNMLGAVDVATGKVWRVVRGAGPDLAECTVHPDTGALLVGVKLPGWDVLCDMVRRAASGLPNCHVQGWDVALTDDGPLVIELEGNGGHPQMVQLAQGRGLYVGRFREFYDRHLAKLPPRRRFWRK